MPSAKKAAEAGPAPDCECHGERMYWNSRADLTAGGYWRCGVASRASHAQWAARNRDYIAQKMREWRDANHEHRRHYQRRLRYGISREDYVALVEKQGGRCALCGVLEADATKRALHVDHDHASGRVRGLLCMRCNTAIERLSVDGWLDRAGRYMSK